MTRSVSYLDSSAIVKLVARETESDALFHFVTERPQRVSSVISRVEVIRAARRAGGRHALVKRAIAVMQRVALIKLDEYVLELARAVDPETLRTLDALQLATALSIADDLAHFVTYDARLGKAAADAGLETLTPS